MRARRLGWAGILVLVLASLQQLGWLELPAGTGSPEVLQPAPVDARTPAGSDSVARARERRLEEVWVEGRGIVERLLADDREGSRHQRFILRLADGATLLVVHNIDLAPRAPARPGAAVGFRGKYVWNERGGLVHWTHHDPDGGAGGHLRVDGRRFE